MKSSDAFTQIESGNASPAKEKLLNAALCVIRAKGYAATTVDDICRQAHVTKGSFFHHFKSKDDLALSSVAHWRTLTEHFFASAPYHRHSDPLDRLLGYLAFRDEIATGDLPSYTCLLGTLVQETYDTHPAIREACQQALTSHIAELTRDVEAARTLHAPHATWPAESLGNLIQATLQGSFIFAKAQQSPTIIRENLTHLRSYLRLLFNVTETGPEALIPQIQAQEEESHDARTHYTD